MNDRTILSLDPSSTAIGWATMSPPAELVSGGVIRPDVKGDSYDRIADMNSALYTLLEHTRPDVILIEWTLGKVGRRRHKGKGAGLAVYGAGVGAAAMTCRWYQRQVLDVAVIDVIPILENEWTRGVAKQDRQLAVSQQYPLYQADLDPGCDLSDAIGMALWWIKERRVRPAARD